MECVTSIHTSRVDEEQVDEDDWFFDSIKRYNELAMYDLQGVLTTATLKTEDQLVIATSRDDRHEIFELELPHKLISKNPGLTNNRDFQMRSAGYTKGKVNQILLTENNNIFTSEADGIHRYKLSNNDKSDLITHDAHIVKDAEFPEMALHKKKIYYSPTVDHLHVYNIETDQSDGSMVFLQADMVKEKMSTIKCLHNAIYACINASGNVVRRDMRVGRCTVLYCPRNTGSGRWDFDISPNEKYMAVGSSEGVFCVQDISNVANSVKSTVFPEVPNNNERPVVKFGPGNDLVSYSYANRKNVDIVTILPDKNIKHVFAHDGHRGNDVSRITCHVWHPTVKHLIFSADNSGQLQGWRFKIFQDNNLNLF